MVGSFVRGEIVGESAGRAGQNVGQALEVSPFINDHQKKTY